MVRWGERTRCGPRRRLRGSCIVVSHMPASRDDTEPSFARVHPRYDTPSGAVGPGFEEGEELLVLVEQEQAKRLGIGDRIPTGRVEDRAIEVLCDLLSAMWGVAAPPRRRFRRALVAAALLAAGGGGVAFALRNAGLPSSSADLTSITASRTSRVDRQAAQPQPVSLPATFQVVRVLEPPGLSRPAAPLPCPAPPEPAIVTPPRANAPIASVHDAPYAGGEQLAARPGAAPPLRDTRPQRGEPWVRKWVFTLRNGNVFVVDRAAIAETFVTLWVENGVVELPRADLRDFGWKESSEKR